MHDGVNVWIAMMTSDGIRPSRFGEKTLRTYINQVIIDLVAHDKVVEDSHSNTHTLVRCSG